MSYNGWRQVRFDDFVPGMKKNNLSILVWTVLFLLDLCAVLAMQYFVFYPIAAPDTEMQLGDDSYPDFSDAAYFDGCEILDMYGAGNDHYWVLYRDPARESHMVCIGENDIFHRHRIDKGSDTLISAEAEVTVLTMDCTTHNRTFRILNGERIDRELQEYQHKFLGSLLDGPSKQMGLSMFLAVLILLFEYGIYEQFRRIVRGE